MSASYFGGEVKYTKRYRIGQQLGGLCRHFLLMTATPHNGKEEDFQLFMALLDGDRFECRFRDGVHYADTADMMRRLTKEELLRFDARPLFPERRAYTAKYELSPEEATLYGAVTEYVRTEMNRVARDSRTATAENGTMSASPYRSCNAGWRPRRPRSIDPSSGAVNGSNANLPKPGSPRRAGRAVSAPWR